MRVLIRSGAQYIPGTKNTPTLPKIDGPLLTGPEVTQSNPFLYSRSLVQHTRSNVYFSPNKTRQLQLLQAGASLVPDPVDGADITLLPLSAGQPVLHHPALHPSEPGPLS